MIDLSEYFQFLEQEFCILVLNADASIKSVNSYFCKKFAINAEHLIGQSYKSLQISNELNAMIAAIIQNPIASTSWQKKLKCDITVEKSFFFDFKIKPYLNSQNQLTHLILIASESLEQFDSVDHLSQLAETHRILDLALKASKLGTFDWHIPSNSVRYDLGWAEMLGYDLSELEMSFSTWQSLVHPEDLMPSFEKIEAYKNGTSNVYYNVHRMKHKLGHWLYILAQGGYTNWDEKGNPIRFTGIHIDVTKQKNQELELIQAKEKAIQAEKMKSAFLANMSHEIRTPLNGIIGCSELLAGTTLTKEQKELLQTAKASAQILLGIINDVLDFSKIESGHLSIESHPFSVLEMLSDCIKVVAPRIKEKGLNVEIKSNLNCDWFVGDVSRVKQIVMNYLSNAIKFTMSGSIFLILERKLNTQTNNLDLEITVQDQGMGISPNDLPKLFKEFSQTDAGNSRKFGGTGLGLAISKKLATAMQGEVFVESQLGVGSSFGVRLPLKESNAKDVGKVPSLDAIDVSSQFFGMHVLIAEDNTINQLLIKKVLAKIGVTCDIGGNGLEAIKLLEQSFQVNSKKYDVIFMDIQMPEMDGLEAATYITTKFKGLHPPIVAMTANAFQEDRSSCYAVGMVDFIAKPFKIEKILEVLEQRKKIPNKKLPPIYGETV